MFERATRMKLRFPFKGDCNVEDLWDLSVTHLDKIYGTLIKDQESSKGESLLRVSSPQDKTLSLQIEIVKYIVEVKLKEADDRKSAADKSLQKTKIQQIIAQKEDESLLGMDLDELKKLQDTL